MKTARARGRKGGRPRIMTVDKLRYARHLSTANSTTCQSQGDCTLAEVGTATGGR